MILTLLLNLSIMLTKIILTIMVTIVAFFIIAIVADELIKKIVHISIFLKEKMKT